MEHASRSANQRVSEPFPASATESETETPGAADPQQPGEPAAGGSGGPGDPASVPSTGSDEPAPATSEELPVVQGLHVPEVDEPDPRT